MLRRVDLLGELESGASGLHSVACEPRENVDDDRFVDLDVRSELEAGDFGVLGHSAQITVEDLGIENERGSGEILFRETTKIAPGDSSLDLIVAELGARDGAGAQGR